ncbi:MAG TPA: MFS transporter [Burkholderiaceae bacterium]|jgi:MFS family permease|nr:MFS transporter [Burkholderiaceae bacterium]
MASDAAPWKIVRILGFTQVVSWGSLYYAIAILAPEIQRELGWRPEIVFGAFSWSLLVAGLASAPAGILLDRFGGRPMMGAGSLLAGAGLLLLGTTHSVAQYFLAWSLLGVSMALVLYEAAFAAIHRELMLGARRAISILTLFGGFASTVFWPLTLKLNNLVGWRDTYLIYGALHLALCAPLHAMLATGPRRRGDPAGSVHPVRNYTLKEALHDPTFWKLAFAFAANGFIFSALSVHLIPTLQRFGHSAAMAVAVSTIIGPMQVAGRIGEMALAHRSLPQTVGKVTFASLPAALLALIFFGEHQIAAAAFCILYGLGNGIITIVRGTIPQALFGRENYGAISGAMAGPAMFAKAAGPLGVAALISANPSPYPLLAALLAVALLSLLCYLAAIRAPRATLPAAR